MTSDFEGKNALSLRSSTGIGRATAKLARGVAPALVGRDDAKRRATLDVLLGDAVRGERANITNRADRERLAGSACSSPLRPWRAEPAAPSLMSARCGRTGWSR
jgi:NAD(P)-dependent dehydrogenase (short-subunit alcohol dehydrogenase family)